MAGRVQWRRFGFFDKDTVNENIDQALGSSPTCASAEGGILLFGDGNGNISMADRNFSISWTHKAFSGPVRGVSYLYDVINHKRQYVVAIGEDSRATITTESKSPNNRDPYVIKVFSTADLSHPIQAFLVTSPTLQENSSLTCFAVTSNGYQIAVGYSSGAILLFSGNFLSEGSVGRQYVPQPLLLGHKLAITGLFYCELNFSSLKSSTNDRNVRLYAVLGGESTTSANTPQQLHSDPEIADAGILVFDTSFSTFGGGGAGSAINRQPPRVLDFIGAAPQCSSLMKQTYELVVGREEGVFSYSIEDRGGAAGFEGEKQCVTAVGRYILVGCLDEKTKRTLITIYDLRNKFISMSYLLPLGDTVRMVLSDGGVAYIITSSWSLIRFREKDTASKLDVLLRKSLYPLAISLAAEEQSDVSEVMRLYKMYADHLYKKNDFDGAVAQYCYTIGFVQPSYVIRRFLDTQRINNLTVYLEKLHQKGLATKDHTTLLLTCYTKTNNTVKLSEFCQLKSGEVSNPESNPKTGPSVGAGLSLNFDVITAIVTLHEAGFDEHALRLALLNEKHEEYIHISLISKSKKDVDRALAYLLTVITIGDLPMNAIIEIVYKFGSLFLLERPTAFTTLLIQLCTGSLDRKKLRDLIFVDSSEETIQGAADLEMEIEAVLTPQSKATGKSKSQKGVYVLSDYFPVEDALSVYADDEKYLRQFIEGVSEGMRVINMTMPPRLTELLLELYLVEYQSIRSLIHDATSGNLNRVELATKLKSLEDRILAILDGASSVNTEYDISNALLLMHSFGFENGEMFLFEKMQSTDLILRRCIETGNERGIMRVLKREGRKDPELFVQVLTYFVRLSMTNPVDDHDPNSAVPQKLKDPDDDDDEDEDDNDEDERWDLISEVLTLVERENVLTPMQIIPILSENPNLPLYIASRFIKRTLRETSDELMTLEKEVSHMKRIVQGVVQEGIAARQHKINQQSAISVPERKNPAVNVHSGIIGVSGLRGLEEFDDEDEFEAQQAEAEREAERNKWMNIKKAQTERTGDHESFFAELEHSSDGFGTIAAYFGKTIIS